ncbi:hypothetical protein [Streptomyces sp. NPDC059071]|uniref:hypothetical protein n=1 Tax=unclassified Streptomyces TaxID=2593676 RepID=UPI00362DC2C6
MGNHFQTLVVADATAAEAAQLARRGLDWLVAAGIVRAERTDCVLGAPLGHPPGPAWERAVAEPDWEPDGGLAVHTGRQVFHAGQDAPEFAVCPGCATRTALVEDTWQRFDAAIRVWAGGDTAAARVACPACGRDGDVTAWQWHDDRFALACLGFAFWDWTEFGSDFLTDFAEALGGRRVVRVWGKL